MGRNPLSIRACEGVENLRCRGGPCGRPLEFGHFWKRAATRAAPTTRFSPASWGRSLLRSVALTVLMLARCPLAAGQCVSPALELPCRGGISTSPGKGPGDFTDRRVKPHEVLFHPAPRSPQQLASHDGAESQGSSKTFRDLTPAELARQVPELKHLESAESQEMLPLILKRVGATVADFFDNFSNTTCTEHILSAVDTPLTTLEEHYDAKFNYVALVKPGSDKTRLQEFRTDSKGELVPYQSQQAVVTIGFIDMTVHFHPDYQRDSRFRYLGREVVEGQNTYVVTFAQRPEVARHMGGVEFEHKTATVFAQGVAWIDPVNFRILRLRTDIQKPELNVGLQRQTTQVEYSEVTFKHGGKTLWLPREVTVTGQLGRYVFHNRHSYSDYRLFVVQTDQKK